MFGGPADPNKDIKQVHYISSGSYGGTILPEPFDKGDLQIVSNLEVLNWSYNKRKNEIETNQLPDQDETEKKIIDAQLKANQWVLNRSKIYFFTKLGISLLSWLMALTLMIFGMVLTYQQFNYKVPTQAIITDEPVSNSEQVEIPTEITLSATEIKIQTSLIGVLILGVSSLFFYLYLRYIYVGESTKVHPYDIPSNQPPDPDANDKPDTKPSDEIEKPK